MRAEPPTAPAGLQILACSLPLDARPARFVLQPPCTCKSVPHYGLTSLAALRSMERARYGKVVCRMQPSTAETTQQAHGPALRACLPSARLALRRARAERKHSKALGACMRWAHLASRVSVPRPSPHSADRFLNTSGLAWGHPLVVPAVQRAVRASASFLGWHRGIRSLHLLVHALVRRNRFGDNVAGRPLLRALWAEWPRLGLRSAACGRRWQAGRTARRTGGHQRRYGCRAQDSPLRERFGSCGSMRPDRWMRISI